MCIFLYVFSLGKMVYAVGQTESPADEIYQEQFSAVNASDLYDNLPQSAKDELGQIGITSVSRDELSHLQFDTILKHTISVLGNNSKTPLCGLAVCIAAMLLCSLFDGFKSIVSERHLSGIVNAVGTMSACIVVVVPLCQTIQRAVEVLNGASGFMMLYIPIMSGLMISSGKENSGTSYYHFMMYASQGISLISSKLVSPITNSFLALTVTSSLSPRMNLSGVCESIYKICKWLITFTMSVFVTIISLQTIVTSSMDNVSRRALRFTVSSFVPVVGGALGEALTVFSGSLELLKSGAGVFVIIAAAALFLPVLAECVVWQFSLFLLSSISDIFGLSQMTKLFRTISKAVALTLALLLCVLTVLIISTVLVLLMGKS